MEGLDDTFDAIVFVGYHAKADAPRGLFAHTGSGIVRDLQINGRSVGEGGMNAALAAWYGVPVVVVSGDDVAIAEVKESVPGVRGVVVKRAINVRAVELKPLAAGATRNPGGDEGRRRRRRKGAPQTQGPYRVQMRYRSFTHAEVVSAFREIELVAPDTVAFSRDTMPEAYRLIRVLYRFINPD